MPRFFFQIDGEEPDQVGVDLPDGKTARSEAIKAAGEILRDIDGALSSRDWIMQVEDDGHRCVFELRFSVKSTA